MKELIKYPTAELAKEKGYPQNIPYDHYIIGEEKLMTDNHYKNFLHEDFSDKLLGCPTQAELQQWIRVEHKIYVYVTPSNKGGYLAWNSQYVYTKRYNKTYESFLPQWASTNNDSYEDAIENGLYKALNLIKS